LNLNSSETTMLFSDYLGAEWRPALGCTEPAAVAWATALASNACVGPVKQVRLICDPRIYKNCYAVGLPNSGGKIGLLWALAIGANLEDGSRGLRSFESTTPETLDLAQCLLDQRAVEVEVDVRRTELFIDVTVVCEGGVGRAVVEREHTNLTCLEQNGQRFPIQESLRALSHVASIRASLAGMRIEEMMAFARSLTLEDRAILREGIAFNTDVARKGMCLVPEKFIHSQMRDGQGRAEMYVCAGVTARMSGVSQTVMTLAGSGNKGITVSIPIWLWGTESGHTEERIDEALAFACLITSATTHHLGTLSAACGSAIAAGAGIAAGLVMLDGGDAYQAGLAMSNVVGTLAGMICDGAKVGCSMKTVTGVEAAFRAANYAIAGQGIPATNGIVGKSGETSLIYLGLVVSRGMANVDAEILDIMQKKLKES
jgi:L-cysteine desulfidase